MLLEAIVLEMIETKFTYAINAISKKNYLDKKVIR